MEIFNLLDTLEDSISNGKKIPFSNKCIIDENEVVDLIHEIRENLPDELKQAKWVKEERQRILNEAQKEARWRCKGCRKKDYINDRRT